MLVKTISGKYGRIQKDNKGHLNIKVLMLNENLHPLRAKGQKVYEFHRLYELIFKPEVIIQL